MCYAPNPYLKMCYALDSKMWYATKIMNPNLLVRSTIAYK